MLNNSFLTNKIYHLITEAKLILLIAHQKPDGDTLGSTAAFSLFLDQLGKNYRIFCADQVPDFFYFLPNIKKFTNQLEQTKEEKFDLVIAIDCGDFKRTGLSEFINSWQQPYQIINLDHHQSNPQFGHFNIVQPELSSTAEIIFYLFREWKVMINKEMATALLNGVFTDTGAFSTPSTTLNSLITASFLLNYGGRLQEINKYNFKNKTLNSLKLWGRAMERLTINKKYQLAHTIIFKKDLEEFGATDDDLEGLSNFFNNLNNVKASLVLREEGDKIRGSLRTIKDDIDVSRLARIFDGGGHPKASGFTIKGQLINREGRWRVE